MSHVTRAQVCNEREGEREEREEGRERERCGNGRCVREGEAGAVQRQHPTSVLFQGGLSRFIARLFSSE